MTTRRDALRAIGGLAAMAVSPGWTQAAATDRPPRETLGLALTEEQVGDGVAFLRDHPSVDIHAHPGLFFLRDAPDPTPGMLRFGQPFEDRAIAALAGGRVSCALFAGVSDARLLEVSRTGITAGREFAPGEAYADYRRQLARLTALVAGGRLVRAETVTDVRRAHRTELTSCMFSVEGGDFIEDRLERVAQAAAAGVRLITIVHYHVNQIGDIQTAPPRHGGITPLGRRIVRAMNRSGIVVDLAHAPLSVTRGAVEASASPVVVSHTNLSRPGVEHPRLIGVEQAKLVTARGGVIGSVPSGVGQKTMAHWIDNIVRMADILGAGAVGIGTDMDANFQPVFTNHRLWHLVPAALLARGSSKAELSGIMGGNFLRVLAVARK